MLVKNAFKYSIIFKYICYIYQYRYSKITPSNMYLGMKDHKQFNVL